MRVSIEEAEGQLTELVKLANRGEEVVLMQDGLPSVRLQPVAPATQGVSDFDAALAEVRKQQTPAREKVPRSPEDKARLLDRLQKEVREKKLPAGPDAASSQDYLYDELGLPK